MVAVTSPPRARTVFGAVAAAIDEVALTSWASLDDASLTDALADVSVLRNRLDALAGSIAVVAEQGAVQRNGARKSSIWVGANTSGSPAETRHDIRTVSWLADYGEFAEAYRAGVLSRRHVDRLREAERPVTRVALLRDQAMIIDFAERLSFEDFGKAMQYWVNAADPDGTIPDEQVRNNRVTLRRRPDGGLGMDADLDPLIGTAVHDALEIRTRQLRDEDAHAGISRTRGQRRAAALAELIAKGAQRADGTVGTPLMHIVVGQSLAEQLIAAQVDETAEITPDFDDPNFRCEFIDGTPVHPRLAAALLGIAELRRIVLSADSQPTDVSVKARSFPQWMRDAGLVATRGRCSETGCDAATHWLHADHVRPVAKGGQTRLDNEQPLCSSANRAKGDQWNPTDPPDRPPNRPAA